MFRRCPSHCHITTMRCQEFCRRGRRYYGLKIKLCRVIKNHSSKFFSFSFSSEEDGHATDGRADITAHVFICMYANAKTHENDSAKLLLFCFCFFFSNLCIIAPYRFTFSDTEAGGNSGVICCSDAVLCLSGSEPMTETMSMILLIRLENKLVLA